MQWFRENRPDAIVTGNGDLMQILAKEGIRVPEDVSLASPYQAGPITYVNQRFTDWGVWAMNTLGGLIKNNEVGMPDSPVETLIRGRLVHMGTTRGQSMSYQQEISVPELSASLNSPD